MYDMTLPLTATQVGVIVTGLAAVVIVYLGVQYYLKKKEEQDIKKKVEAKLGKKMSESAEIPPKNDKKPEEVTDSKIGAIPEAKMPDFDPKFSVMKLFKQKLKEELKDEIREELKTELKSELDSVRALIRSMKPKE